jgi:transcriptional regulator with XRE-family HTH domain
VPPPSHDAAETPEVASRLLGLRLRAVRADRALTLAEVAEASGVTSGHLSHIERGIRLPSLGTLLALARTYELLVTDLLDDLYPFGTDRPPGAPARRKR